MEALRRGARGWIAKILFFFLILSFAVWGIADVFTGFSRGSLAKVGPISITANEFQQAFQNELYQISQQAGRRITPEQGRQIGLDTRAMTRLVGGAAIETHANELGLGLSDEAIAAEIQAEPSFHGLDGKFSRVQFEGFLRQIGLSERGFLEAKRKEDLRQQITGAMTSAIAVPAPLVEAMHAYNDETRIIEHITLDAEKAAPVAAPDEAKLRATYDANKRQFMSPEYRKVVVLTLSIEALKGRMTVSDDEIRAGFEQDREGLSRPERRRVEQIAFKDKATAEAARQKIVAGQGFLDAAKDTGAKDTDIRLGLLTRREMIDPKIADAAFSLEKDKVSDVVEGRFAIVLVRVTEIQAGKDVVLDEVKDKVRDRIAREKAKKEANTLHDGVDDNRAAGKPLKDIAEILKLPYVEIAAIDRTGKAPDGKPAVEGADAERIGRAAFDAEIGIEREPVELADGGYAWVDLKATTPAAERAFETVADEVKALYVETERKRLLSELAPKLIARAKAGETLPAIALEFGGKTETTLPVTRTVIPQGLTQAAVTQAFAVNKGAAGTTDTADGKSRILFRVKDVIPAAPITKEQRETLAADVRAQMQGDVLSSYVAALQDRLGVTINQAELRRLTGADAQR